MKLMPALAAILTAGALTGGAVTMVWGRAPVKDGMAFSVDQLRMTELCLGGAPVYAAPDGLLWTWSAGWNAVDPRQAAACPGKPS